MRKNVIAIMYDFDKTLCGKDMQEYTFIPNLGLEALEFWKEADILRKDNKMDQVLAYMYLMFKKMVDNFITFCFFFSGIKILYKFFKVIIFNCSTKIYLFVIFKYRK